MRTLRGLIPWFHGRGARQALAGFSLVELMVGLAIAGVVLSAAVTSVLAVLQTLKRTERQIELDMEAKQVAEFLVMNLQGIGGGSLRPWHGLLLERDWSGEGSDRLTVLEVDPDLDECVVLARAATGAVIDVGGGASCCLDASWEHRHLLAVDATGAEWASLYATGMSLAACNLVFPPGNNGLGQSKALLGGTFSGGAIIPVVVKRYWLDHTHHRLMVDEALPGSNSFHSSVLSDRVYDLQFALGYDASPADGDVVDTRSAADEWLGNHASDAMTAGALVPATDADLRMIAVGVVVGAPLRGVSIGTSALDGPFRQQPHTLLRSVEGKAYLRNSGLFF